MKTAVDYFKEISRIPRKSGDEGRIGEYLMQFAKARGLFCSRDAAGNIVIRKKSNLPDYGGPAAILQAHMDMVYEKREDSSHRYEDGIDVKEENGFLYAAKGTTLGADNGIGVAYILSFLDRDDRKIPDLEALITVGEEEGLAGVKAFDARELRGTFLMNLDGEGEGVFLVSCAGGARCLLTRACVLEEAAADGKMEISLTGLTGGHSGLEIGAEKANGIRILGRLMYRLLKKMPLETHVILAESRGKANAIASGGRLVLALKKCDVETVKSVIRELELELAREMQTEDRPVFLCQWEEFGAEKEILSMAPEETLALAELLCLLPCGVFSRNQKELAMVKTSANIGALEMDVGNIQILASCRSSVGSQKKELLDMEKMLAKRFGYDIQIFGEYPAWERRENSALREICGRAYKNLTGKEPVFQSVHGGLECGYLSEKMDSSVDMIAMGANLYDVHTPAERAEIASVCRVEEQIAEILEKLSGMSVYA